MNAAEAFDSDPGGLMTAKQPTLVPEHDANDGKEWSAMDIEDLALALKDGGTVEGAAYFLGGRAQSRKSAIRPKSLH